ncbi:helix-turn-helix domain-containing protein [Haloactinopolyspora sp.]|uniref:helix-turn-helix domain-containing protein n=1 Tax=Haloactinopolyspora sp. TaxID=1966353 RepID=UPI0026236CE9|nr:helix-turn-helix domain-containing protein [Haloactinopolyspora sp.]
MTSGTVPLSRLIAAPSWRDVVGLTSVDGAKRQVRDAHLLADVRPGQLTEGVLYGLVNLPTAFDVRSDVLIRRLADESAAGLVVPAERTGPDGSGTIPASTIRLAERLGVAVFTAEDVSEAILAARAVIRGGDDDRAVYVERVVDAVTAVPSELGELCRRLGQALSAPVAVFAADGRRLAGDDVPGVAVDPSRPGEQRNPTADGYAVAVPVTDAGAESVALWLVAQLSAELNDHYSAVRTALRVAAFGVRTWQAERRLVAERDARLRSGLLAMIRQGHDEPSPILRRQAGELGWRLDGWHVGFAIGLVDGDEATAVLDIGSIFAGEAVTVEIVPENHGWSGWVSMDHEPSAAELNTVVTALRRGHRTINRWVTTYMGVGRAYRGSRGLANSLAEAHDAAQLAVNRKELGRFLYIDRLGLAQLLLAWTRTDTFQPAAHELLAPLGGHQGHLTETLNAYLDAESNLTETAAVLGVHRNTVATRIQRIEAILGVDLSNVDERLALHLACRTTLSPPSPPWA